MEENLDWENSEWALGHGRWKIQEAHARNFYQQEYQLQSDHCLSTFFIKLRPVLGGHALPLEQQIILSFFIWFNFSCKVNSAIFQYGLFSNNRWQLSCFILVSSVFPIEESTIILWKVILRARQVGAEVDKNPLCGSWHNLSARNSWPFVNEKLSYHSVKDDLLEIGIYRTDY